MSVCNPNSCICTRAVTSLCNPNFPSSSSYSPSLIGCCASLPSPPHLLSSPNNTFLSALISSSSRISVLPRDGHWNSFLQNAEDENNVKEEEEEEEEEVDMNMRSHRWKPIEEGDSKCEENEEEMPLEEEEEYETRRPFEDRKVYVVNLPFYMDSAKLAELFKPAGVIEVSQVIYSRETGQSRGFGFVTMSTAKEASEAIQMFDNHEIAEGRFLRVKMATVKSPGREFTTPCKVFVRNVPSGASDEDLAAFFRKHVEVVSARVICDRETGDSRGYGFVTLHSEEDLQHAIDIVDGQVQHITSSSLRSTIQRVTRFHVTHSPEMEQEEAHCKQGFEEVKPLLFFFQGEEDSSELAEEMK